MHTSPASETQKRQPMPNARPTVTIDTGMLSTTKKALRH
ncbi:hypothetical protein NT01EI_1423 [Edwardsiella ictaluri 93-146]|uniref:Uncharacterized protein n=1 Tax=Edwardsiella ictaluri (strain 93-146) TaxID=634503 RepID=C5BDR3_EDWI9|nr:hypothetical protein NT01EI_1423 [Edwardsiella ictaluri 93-146]